MTDKEFKKLSRSQLIDIIYQLQLELDKMTEKNQALEAALGRLTRPVNLKIWTDSEYVGGAVANGWPEGWEKAGWQTTKGKPVKDAEKWASVLGRIRDCEVSVRIRERHEYSRWMEDQLKKVQIAPVQQKEGKNV